GSLSLNKGCAPNASHSLILLLLGFSRARVSPSVLFLLFLVIYLTTMMGNVTLVLLISQDPRLHSPMYYLLHGLSVIDMGLSTVTLPQLLAHLVTHDPAIPAARCLAQFFFFYAFGVTDTLLAEIILPDPQCSILPLIRNLTVVVEVKSSRDCCAIVDDLEYSPQSIHGAVTQPSFISSKGKWSMRPENQSSVSEFLLLGFPIRPEQQGVFFALFLGVYLTTVLGNLLIFLLIRLDSRLHTPMYFFLKHLALTDVSFSSVSIPKMLMDAHTEYESIPYAGCIAQMYFFIFFTDLDSFLITSVAYDHYVAVCHPLHYTTIMREQLCAFLLAVSWILSGASSLSHTLLLTQLSFCANTVPHFFCDLSALLKLSCSDIFLNELVMFTVGVVVITLPFYLMVSLYCGSVFGQYLFSTLSNFIDRGITVALMYTVVTPMLNPFIYSLRNRDIKGALGKLFSRATFFSQ
ncbi:hypothetical protein E2I00_002142, partial [Balaenoptera physalus]